jgi:glycerophosphoryl diester phosphodiesterase
MKISSTNVHSSTVLRGVIGHRGSPTKAPENTLVSFEQALRDGADSIELDVQVSRDGELVVIHDSTLERTTDGVGSVRERSLAELKRLDAGSWFDPRFSDQTIPTLKESLQWARGKTRVDIEVKPESVPYLTPEALVGTVREQRMEGQVAITSFDREFVESVEKKFPRLQTGLLISARPTLGKVKRGAVLGALGGLTAGLLSGTAVGGCVGAALGGALVGAGSGYLLGTAEVKRAVRETSADSVLPHWFVADSSVVKAAKEQGKSVASYPVNHGLVADVLRWRGGEGLVTDVPDRLTTSQ